jgi:hypothetical protein
MFRPFGLRLSIITPTTIQPSAGATNTKLIKNIISIPQTTLCDCIKKKEFVKQETTKTVTISASISIFAA